MEFNPLMAASATQAASQTTSTTDSTTRTVNSSLGKDEFLQLLVAQLQNQDPTNPMDNTQFIAQMAQFSALEQMQQLNTAFTYSQAYSLVDKTVSVDVTAEDGTTTNLTGTVSGVITVNKTPYLVINGELVSMDTPLTVIGKGMDDSLLQGVSMIGKYITGTYVDKAGKTQTVTGQVTKAAMVDGETMLYVGEQAVALYNVTSVSATAPAATTPTTTPTAS